MTRTWYVVRRMITTSVRHLLSEKGVFRRKDQTSLSLPRLVIFTVTTIRNPSYFVIFLYPIPHWVRPTMKPFSPNSCRTGSSTVFSGLTLLPRSVLLELSSCKVRLPVRSRLSESTLVRTAQTPSRSKRTWRHLTLSHWVILYLKLSLCLRSSTS